MQKIDRLKIFQIAVIIFAVVVAARFFYWQFFSRFARERGIVSPDNELPAARGEIFTSDGFPLVINQQAFLLYGKPREVKNPTEVAKKLAPNLISEKFATSSAQLLPDDQKTKDEEIKNKESEIANKLTAPDPFWVQLARKVPLLAREKIESANLDGFGFEKDEKRFYPEASMAAQLLGFVGSDKLGHDTGYYGLEGYYNLRLEGKPGRFGQESDPFGLPILVGRYRPISPVKGSSLHLNIDRSIQFMVEEKLRRATEKYGAKSGTVIVANPHNGHILAMATYPTYNPGLREEFNEDFYKNPAVSDTYEPGSTFKLITMAAALDLGLVEPNTRCHICSGPRQIGGFEISTWNKKYRPDSTMTEVIIHSDNIGMTFVADKLGVGKFYEYITKFGFDKITGIDIQEESPGFVRSKQEWKPIDLATASFGQGIAVTPIQMIQAVSAIANGGKLTTPAVVNKIIEDKTETLVYPEKKYQVITARTAAQITEMMVNAIDKGEARAFAPIGYRIAGKTGTAQIPVAGHYDPNKTIASFIGFAPAENPKFVMLVRFTEPTSSPFGSETAAPTFFAIAKELFNYWGISPSK